MRAKIKLHTVNVIEVCNGVVDSIRSFTETPKGNKRAEKAFVRMVKERNRLEVHSADDLDNMLSDGVFDDERGYQLFLTHSI